MELFLEWLFFSEPDSRFRDLARRLRWVELRSRDGALAAKGGDRECWAILAFIRIWILGSKIMVNGLYKYLCVILSFVVFFFRNLINLNYH